MPTATTQPTSNNSPDPGQGGAAVTSPINTGHAATVASATQAGEAGSQSQTKTALWSAFANVFALKTRVTLKFDWDIDADCDASSSNIDSGASSSYQFTVDYSTNNGGSWSSAISFLGSALVIVGPNSAGDSDDTSGSFSVDLPTPGAIDISQIRVRDRIFAQASNTGGANASASSLITAIVSNIRLEVVTPEGQLLIMM